MAPYLYVEHESLPGDVFKFGRQPTSRWRGKLDAERDLIGEMFATVVTVSHLSVDHVTVRECVVVY